ncbi:MAG TPA: efflux RND transporter periplasmic adaptor subunit [Pyrinomonadaceae bacterium]|nr:efflux RND transporter periplasmic adaptor subunit [Pyrinomonadaceae bacterium]
MIFRNNTKLIGLWLLLVAAALFAIACNGSKAAQNKNTQTTTASPAVVQVSTTTAIMRQVPRFFEATGSLAADEQTDVAPAVGGKVVAVSVDLGSFVQRGAVLVRLDDRDARIRLEQAQAQVAQQQAAVRQAEARIGLRPGQSFDPTNVPDVKSARVALDLANKQMARFDRLIETGDVSRSAYDQQRAQRDQLLHQYEVALEQARQNYAAVETARAAVASAKTQIDSARKAIADAVITAPIGGYVADRQADLGEYISPSSKVVTIVRTNPLRVRIDIPEQSVGNVQTGQTVSVTVSAFPDRTFAGRIARISPNVTATSRTLTVEAEVQNPDNALKPGQFATVRIQQPQTTPTILVPARAVRTEGTSSSVFVIKNGRAEQRVVQLGQAEGDLMEIRTGLAADEAVATSNVEQLQDGMAVTQ